MLKLVQRIFSRFLGRGMLIVLAVLVVVGLTHAFILRMLAWPLMAGTSAAPADYYCIQGDELGMDGYEPVDAAAEWYRASAGRKILLLAPPSSRIVEIGAVRSFEETCLGELSKRGLPRADVGLIRTAAGYTWGTAHAMRDWLQAHPDSTVSIAGSQCGSGRQRYVLNKVLGPADAQRVRLVTLPDPECRLENWWRSRRGVKEFMYAWLGLMYAWVERDQERPHLPNAAKFQEEVRARIGEAPP